MVIVGCARETLECIGATNSWQTTRYLSESLISRSRGMHELMTVSIARAHTHTHKHTKTHETRALLLVTAHKAV